MTTEATGYEAGLSGDAQIKIAVKEILRLGGKAEMKRLYPALEREMNGLQLSDQGKASFRFFINKVAVEAGLIYPHDKNQPGWRLTPSGKDFAQQEEVNEITINTDTEKEEQTLSNSARGLAFEIYALEVLKAVYPSFAWHHQGLYKVSERGLDFIGDRLGDSKSDVETIGVQVKFHRQKNAPTQIEWLKFLAGCFARRVDLAIFITTGRLTSEQYREARESNVIVIQGEKEITRIAKTHNLKRFNLFEEKT